MCTLCIFLFSTITMEKMVRYGKMVGNVKLVVAGRSGRKWEMPKIPVSV